MFTSENAGIVLVTFREMGAAHFFNLAAHELHGETIDSREIVSHSSLEQTQSQVAEARSDAERFSVVAAWLEACIPSSKGDPLVAAALSALKRSSGGLRTGDLAESLGISRDRLEKRFRHWVGTTPKQLAAIYRMQRAVRLLQTGVTLSELAFDAGYFKSGDWHFYGDGDSQGYRRRLLQDHYRLTNPNTRPPSECIDSSSSFVALCGMYRQATAIRNPVPASFKDPRAVSNRARAEPPVQPKPSARFKATELSARRTCEPRSRSFR